MPAGLIACICVVESWWWRPRKTIIDRHEGEGISISLVEAKTTDRATVSGLPRKWFSLHDSRSRKEAATVHDRRESIGEERVGAHLAPLVEAHLPSATS